MSGRTGLGKRSWVRDTFPLSETEDEGKGVVDGSEFACV